MPLNMQLNWIKRCYRAKKNQKFEEKVQDCKDGNELQFIKFDFLRGVQKIKIANESFLQSPVSIRII